MELRSWICNDIFMIYDNIIDLGVRVYSFCSNSHFSHLSPVNPGGHTHVIPCAQHIPPFTQLVIVQTGRKEEKGERQLTFESFQGWDAFNDAY